LHLILQLGLLYISVVYRSILFFPPKGTSPIAANRFSAIQAGDLTCIYAQQKITLEI